MRCCRDVPRVIGRVWVFDHRHDRDRQVHPHRVDIGETKESWKLQFDLSDRCIGWFMQSDTNPWKQRGDESQFSLLAEHSLLEEPAPLCRRSFWSENLLCFSRVRKRLKDNLSNFEMFKHYQFSGNFKLYWLHLCPRVQCQYISKGWLWFWSFWPHFTKHLVLFNKSSLPSP